MASRLAAVPAQTPVACRSVSPSPPPPPTPPAMQCTAPTRDAHGHHRHDVGVAAVDVLQQARELQLVAGVLDAREGAQLAERLHVPVAHLRSPMAAQHCGVKAGRGEAGGAEVEPASRGGLAPVRHYSAFIQHSNSQPTQAADTCGNAPPRIRTLSTCGLADRP